MLYSNDINEIYSPTNKRLRFDRRYKSKSSRERYLRSNSSTGKIPVTNDAVTAFYRHGHAGIKGWAKDTYEMTGKGKKGRTNGKIPGGIESWITAGNKKNIFVWVGGVKGANAKEHAMAVKAADNIAKQKKPYCFTGGGSRGQCYNCATYVSTAWSRVRYVHMRLPTPGSLMNSISTYNVLSF